MNENITEQGLQEIYDAATEGMFSGVEVHMLVNEVRRLRAKLDAAYYKLEAVPAYAEYCNQWCMRDGSLMTLDEWQEAQP